MNPLILGELASVCNEYYKKIFALEAAKWDLERACKIQLLEVLGK